VTWWSPPPYRRRIDRLPEGRLSRRRPQLSTPRWFTTATNQAGDLRPCSRAPSYPSSRAVGSCGDNPRHPDPPRFAAAVDLFRRSPGEEFSASRQPGLVSWRSRSSTGILVDAAIVEIEQHRPVICGWQDSLPRRAGAADEIGLAVQSVAYQPDASSRLRSRRASMSGLAGQFFQAVRQSRCRCIVLLALAVAPSSRRCWRPTSCKDHAHDDPTRRPGRILHPITHSTPVTWSGEDYFTSTVLVGLSENLRVGQSGVITLLPKGLPAARRTTGRSLLAWNCRRSRRLRIRHGSPMTSSRGFCSLSP